MSTIPRRRGSGTESPQSPSDPAGRSGSSLPQDPPPERDRGWAFLAGALILLSVVLFFVLKSFVSEHAG
ncbi:MAG TPA: hypothetical protein VHM91_10870 [Verrucomicrobiales bacterium]|nr:hypothetical protein [Verrucomicrobiales bacterium]